MSASFTCAISVASSGDVRPIPASVRRRISFSDGSASSSRLSPRSLDEVLDHPRVHGKQAGRVGTAGAHQVVLILVVGQHQPAHLVGHRHQQLGALVGPDLARGDQRVDQDLDVDLVVGAVDTGGVVHRVGVDAAAGQVELDAAERGDTEVAALADHLGAHLVSVHPHGIVGAVADVGVRLRLGLDVGADAAVEQQVGRSLQDRLDQGGRRQLLDAVRDAQRGAGLRADRDGLLLPAVDAAALADQRAVVVLPAGPRQVE